MDKVNGMDEMISKSLDEIDTIIAQIKGEGEDLSKAMNATPAPEDVSDDVPPEEPTGQEENPPVEGEGTEPGAGEPPVAEGEDNGGEPAPDVDEEKEEEGVEKSLEEELNGNEGVRKALEVSEFLTELVKGISKKLDDHQAAMNKSLGDNLAKSLQGTDSSDMILAKSFEGIMKAQKAVLTTQADMFKSLKEMAEKIEKLESSPVMRKSVPSSNVKPIDKPFVGNEKPNNTLTKSQVVTKLMDGYQNGKLELMGDILAFESTSDINILSPGAKTFLGL